MEIFIIHSSKDSHFISDIKENVFPKTKVNYLEGSLIQWKYKARKMIKETDLLIIIGGDTTKTNKNVLWEIELAQNLNKRIYAIKIDDSFEFSNVIFIELNELKIITNEKYNFEKALFNENITNDIDRKDLLEQYKLILQTSEALVVRRQTVNTFFLSANVLLSTLMGVFLNTRIQDSASYFELYFCILCLIGLILNNSWKKLIKIYGQLNTGKFKVIQSIEEKLPCSLFTAEWLALGEGNNPKKYKSFTKSEENIPLIFSGVYFIAIFLLISKIL